MATATAPAGTKPARVRRTKNQAETATPENQTPSTPPESTPEDGDTGTDTTAPESSESDGAEAGAGSRSIAHSASRTMRIPGVQATFTERALILPEKLTVKAWLEVVESIDSVRDGARWWFGDALNQGEARWGESYAQALDAGKFDYATLRDLKSVAKRFPPEMRIYERSWSHYRAVMAVPLEVAGEILKIAARDDWSVVQTRQHVKDIKSGDVTVRDGTAPAPSTGRQTVPPVVENAPGAQPITNEEAAAIEAGGKPTYACPACDKIFAGQYWHCVGCGGHWPLSDDECPNEQCGVDPVPSSSTAPSAGTAPSPSTAPRVISGEVVTPSDENGVDKAIAVLMSYPFSDLDPSDIAASILSVDTYDDPQAILMSLHNWLGQVIEAVASADDEDDDGPEAPGRDAEIEAEEADEDDSLGDLSDEDTDDDEDDSESDETDGEAEDDSGASDSTLTASQTPPAASAPPASRPISPAPKPGSGKPVRRRRSQD